MRPQQLDHGQGQTDTRTLPSFFIGRMVSWGSRGRSRVGGHRSLGSLVVPLSLTIQLLSKVFAPAAERCNRPGTRTGIQSQQWRGEWPQSRPPLAGAFSRTLGFLIDYCMTCADVTEISDSSSSETTLTRYSNAPSSGWYRSPRATAVERRWGLRHDRL